MEAGLARFRAMAATITGVGQRTSPLVVNQLSSISPVVSVNSMIEWLLVLTPHLVSSSVFQIRHSTTGSYPSSTASASWPSERRR